MFKKYILCMNNGVTFDVKDKVDCVQIIMEEYEKYDACMYDLLASIAIYGFSAEDVVEIYAKCMNLSDGDTILHLRDEWDIELNEEIIGLNIK